MGDAGKIMYGPIGREIFSLGTLLFAVCLAGGQMLSGQIALSSLSNNGLCNLKFTGIFAAVTFVCSLPRTFDGLGWISIPSVLCIFVAGIVGMVGAGLYPEEPREVVAAKSSDFYTAFYSITVCIFQPHIIRILHLTLQRTQSLRIVDTSCSSLSCPR